MCLPLVIRFTAVGQARASQLSPPLIPMPHSSISSQLRLVWPGPEYLPGYVAALQTGWSPNNLRPAVAQEELLQIHADPARFLEGLVDREARGGPVMLPDGTAVPRLPGYRRWFGMASFAAA